MSETNEANRICGTCEHNKKFDIGIRKYMRCENPEGRYGYITGWYETCRKWERKNLNAENE